MFPAPVNEFFLYKQIAATTNVQGTKSYLGGIFVSAASSSPTIGVFDDAASGTGTKLIDTFTPSAGTFYPMPAQALNGLNIVISGTVSCTVFFTPVP